MKGHTARVPHMWCSLDLDCIPAGLRKVAAAAAVDLGNYHIFLLPGLAAAAGMEWNILLGVVQHHPTAVVVVGPG